MHTEKKFQNEEKEPKKPYCDHLVHSSLPDRCIGIFQQKGIDENGHDRSNYRV